MIRKIVILFFLLYAFQYGFAQKPTPNIKRIKLSMPTIIDTLSLIPGSVEVYDSTYQSIPSKLYEIDLLNALLKPTITLQQTHQYIWIRYQHFGLNLKDTIRLTELSNPLLQPSPKTDAWQAELSIDKAENTSTNKQAINTQGHISRGVSVGNAQNLVVQSNMNLHLSGKLTDNLLLDAYLSDKNIPIQPDGYTQQIQAFDQILIHIHKKKQSLQMGDVSINQQQGTFLRFNRKIQGAHYEQEFSKRSKRLWSTEAAFAMSKGKYQRMSFSGKEGVQGPYPLQGAFGETYIMVLAGSEKVYFNGKLLVRGAENDYTIDYNTAELSFTPKRLISAQDRIVVEFEYADRQYSRLVSYGANQFKSQKLKWKIEYFQEGDLKNQPIDLNLNQNEIALLENSSAQTNYLWLPYSDSVPFDATQTLYKLCDTLVENIQYDSIYVYSTNPDSAKYRVGFSYVGKGLGNYVVEQNVSNGKVYRWVAPLNGTPQGSYKPIKKVVTPQNKKMLVNNLDVNLGKRTILKSEIAFSSNNTNTFSTQAEAKRQGYALQTSLAHSPKRKNSQWLMEGTHKYFSKDFTPIDRIETPEFERDWNLNPRIAEFEHRASVKLELAKKKSHQFQINSELLKREKSYQGTKQSLQANYTDSAFNVKLNASLLNSSDTLFQSLFARANTEINWQIKRISLGFDQQAEFNQQTLPGNDTLMANSLKFYQGNASIALNDSTKQRIKATLGIRMDYLPTYTLFNQASENYNLGIEGIIIERKSHHLSLLGQYRKVKNDTNLLNSAKLIDQYFTGRIKHNYQSKRRVFYTQTYYESGSGMEHKRSYTYIAVAQGKGTHIWTDYNNDGQSTLNEFEVAPFGEEANYIRLFTPTNEFVPVCTQQANVSIGLDFYRLKTEKAWMEKGLKKFSNRFTARIKQKHQSNDWLKRLSPYPSIISDSLLMSQQWNYRNIFSFNRLSTSFSLDYLSSANLYRNVLLSGFEQRKTNTQELKLRWNINRQFTFQAAGGYEQKEREVAYSIEKNYQIEQWQGFGKISWQPSTRFRITLQSRLKQKKAESLDRLIYVGNIEPGVKFIHPKKGTISARLNFINNNFSGTLNSPLAFDLTEGHQPGQNMQWNVSLSRTIGKYLQLDLSYTGRKPADESIIHTAQLSLGARF